MLVIDGEGGDEDDDAAFIVMMISKCLKLGAHESKMLQQSVIRGTLLKHFAPVCGETFTGF